MRDHGIVLAVRAGSCEPDAADRFILMRRMCIGDGLHVDGVNHPSTTTQRY